MKSERINFPPGSEWLYLRIYGGARSLEEWLCGSLRDCVYEWMRSGRIGLFWFVRYLDPEYHLRLRFRLPDPFESGILLHKIHQTTGYYMREELLWKIEAGTYEPENERYGKVRIRRVEEWFGLDSLYWLEKTRLHLNSDQGDVWKDAMRSTIVLLNDFRTSVQEKIQIVSRLHDYCASRLGLQKEVRLRIDEKYRRLSGELASLLDPGGRPPEPLLVKRSEESADIIKGLEETYPDRDSLLSSRLLPDLIHMSLNRAFRTRHRMQEFVVYDFILKYLESSLARSGRSFLSQSS
jgi:thiopeptide-type bacteriocin biosynthesis protein